MLTCTWAPTVFGGHQIVRDRSSVAVEVPEGSALRDGISGYVRHLEELGVLTS